MAETGATGTSGNETAAYGVLFNNKPAGPTRKTKLVEVREAYILDLMWRKACRPRHNFPPWKPRPDNPRYEQLIRATERAAAIINESHRHEDDLTNCGRYITNGCARGV
jgi:hypothetical protein